MEVSERGTGPAETQVELATEKLRGLILSGAFPLDMKLAETTVAEHLGISRTPARLALALLEKDGLLVGMPRRGFRVRSYTVDEIVHGNEIRGELEAIAARIVAENGLTAAQSSLFERLVGRTGRLVNSTITGEEHRRHWCEVNLEFHDALIGASGVQALMLAYRQVIRMPLVSPGEILFDMVNSDISRKQLIGIHDDHRNIVDLIVARRSTRAAAMMREHAYRSGENKRRNIMAGTVLPSTPGLALIRRATPNAAAQVGKLTLVS